MNVIPLQKFLCLCLILASLFGFFTSAYALDCDDHDNMDQFSHLTDNTSDIVFFSQYVEKTYRKQNACNIDYPNAGKPLAVINDCIHYLQAALPLIEAGIVEDIQKSCDIYIVLSLATMPTRSFFNHNAIGRDLFNYLNIDTIIWATPNGEVTTFTSEANVLKQLYGATYQPADRIPNIYPHLLKMEMLWGTMRFDPLAAGDFDGDGMEDLLIHYLVSPNSGAMKNTPYILQRKEKDGIIMAIPALEFLKQHNILSIK